MDMETPPKTVGSAIRAMFAAMTRRPMNWNLIDAFARLQEREEELSKRERQPPTKGREPDGRS